jgi:hypothetical protein
MYVSCNYSNLQSVWLSHNVVVICSNELFKCAIKPITNPNPVFGHTQSRDNTERCPTFNDTVSSTDHILEHGKGGASAGLRIDSVNRGNGR